ncbi:serine/threonine protein kinase [Telmatocola sphagniphila]|uniref:Serine/threonine protein kinase n=1 Tax=Telmatocola sphagniphila TaxID=1123043 RepID=A0A8E6B542_9BACT|nr:serine/threonine-protein kinase [Telmatocola sphagniphila]QVL30560.1 serine/threonine protein kinase [Telmatocola sphagniphila]
MKSSIDVRKVDLEVGPKSPSQASPADSESSKTGLLPSTQLNALETVDLEDKVKSLVGYDPLRGRKRLEKYEIIRLLATGGMGAVYKAFDHKLRRNVALKVMLPTAASNMRARDRFLQEARAAARISSDHVVEIYEADEIDNIPFIAQKYLHGNTLDRYLTLKGGVPISQAIRIIRETSLGLLAAHKIGLVHRDIKPSNLWLEAPKGRVKILDFGLARYQEEGASLTNLDIAAGTPSFMSPEQVRGDLIDFRSDLFSLGVVLYLLLTGKLPFPKQNSSNALMAVFTQEAIPVAELNPHVAPELAELTHILLSKDPERRPSQTSEVPEAMEWIEANRKHDKKDSTSKRPKVWETLTPPAQSVIEKHNNLNPFSSPKKGSFSFLKRLF